MIFPIGDDQVEGGAIPLVSYAFLTFNILVFFLQLNYDDALICTYGAIPAHIVNGEDYYTLFTSMFMHGGWLHLIGNMTFLWVFADNIEATIGSFFFFLFYVLGGLVASAAHIYFSTTQMGVVTDCCVPCGTLMPCSEGMKACAGLTPTVGASGAIAAVLGAYLVMFPKSQIRLIIIYFFSTFRVPAILFLGIWIIQQLVSGYMSLGPQTAATAGVAWWAHIGGFVFGVVSGVLFRRLFMTTWRA